MRRFTFLINYKVHDSGIMVKICIFCYTFPIMGHVTAEINGKPFIEFHSTPTKTLEKSGFDVVGAGFLVYVGPGATPVEVVLNPGQVVRFVYEDTGLLAGVKRLLSPQQATVEEQVLPLNRYLY